MGPEMEEDSLNTASTFVKCALGRSPSVPSRRPPLARTQLQPISRKREQNNSYRGANTCAGTRAKETRKHRERSKMRARREHKAGVVERESERSRRILYPPPPRPMSPFRFLPSRPPPPPPDKSDPGGTPGLTPHLAGEIFKFCHVQV